MNITLQRIQLLLAKTNTKTSVMLRDLDIPSSTYSSWYSKNRYPSTEYVIKLAEYFGVSTDYLLGLNEEADEEGYYIDPSTKKMANALNDNLGQRVLFDATKDLPPEDILKVLDFIQQQNKKEGRDE